MASDQELVTQADIILSIVPPRHAVATARRVADACASPAAITARNARRGTTAAPVTVTFVDLNAISAKTVHNISQILHPPQRAPTSPQHRPGVAKRRTSLLARLASAAIIPSAPAAANSSSSSTTETLPPDPIPVGFIDGTIIGAPPQQQPDGKEWTLPSIVLSGPRFPTSAHQPAERFSPSPSPSSEQPAAPTTSSWEDLSRILNFSHISPNLGAASTLKACYAALTNGLTALSVLSLTTAAATITETATSSLSHIPEDPAATTTDVTSNAAGPKSPRSESNGSPKPRSHLQFRQSHRNPKTPPTLLPVLLSHLSTYSPESLSLLNASIPTIPHRSHRWVEEMRQFGETLTDVGHFSESAKVFNAFSDAFRMVADEPEVSKVRRRKRKGGTPEEQGGGNGARRGRSTTEGQQPPLPSTSSVSGSTAKRPAQNYHDYDDDNDDDDDRLQPSTEAIEEVVHAMEIGAKRRKKGGSYSSIGSQSYSRSSGGGRPHSEGGFGGTTVEQEEDDLSLAWRGSWM